MREILAPAGGKDSAIAAINAGADAIYLGLDKFSARSSAENFDLNSYEEVCRLAHAFGVKVHVALNTLIKHDELSNFFSTLEIAWNYGADAIIIQDMYLGAFLKRRLPEVKFHLSTQAGTCNTFAARMAKDMGFDRVILSRETKFEDIEKITKIIETEVFVQGALCTAFSGQCYMSSFAGGNSGNRGRCKQPCRKLYSIDREGFEEKAYRLSLSDLCVGENITKLIQVGVSSFKIEGRMRRPEYVSAAVKYYKNIINSKTSLSDLSDLKRTYNRGNYTKGLSFGQDKSFISSAVQGHIGEFVGNIKVENSKYICLNNQKFSQGDGFKILRGGVEVGGGVYGGTAKNGFIINTRDRLKNGDKVFITTDTALNSRLLSEKRLIDIKIDAEFLARQPARVFINGRKFEGELLENAVNSPLTEEQIKACFKKTDTLPFNAIFGEIKTDGVFIPSSKLNAIRRAAFGGYFNCISANKNAKIKCSFNIPEPVNKLNCKTAVISSEIDQTGAEILIYKPYDYNAVPNINFNGEKFLFVPPYLSDGEVELIKNISGNFDGIYCDSYFGEYLAKSLDKKFFAGTGLNISNTVSLSHCNAEYICLSKELTVKEAECLCTENTFYLSQGNIKLMDLIYCPFGKKCNTCDMRKEYTLTDGDGRAFPLRRNKLSECRFEVYNCADIDCEKVTGILKDNSISERKNTLKTRGHSISRIQ